VRQAVLIITLLISIVAGTVAAHAQAPPPKVRRLGYLGAAGSMDLSTQAFRQGLRDLGYVKEQNTAVEYRFAEGRYERLPQLAAELVGLQVEVIVTAGHNAARAVRQQTTTIPIVVAAGGSWDGLAASLARPGGNVTGLSFLSPDLGGKRLALLREAVPKATRVAVLVNVATPSPPLQWAAVREAAGRLAVSLLRVEYRRASEFDGAFQAAAKQGGQAVLTFRDGGRSQPGTDPRAGGETQAPRDVRAAGLRGGGGLPLLRAEPARPIPARRHLRGQDPEGCQGGGAADRAARQVRARREPQGCQDAGADRAAIDPASSRRGDSVTGSAQARGSVCAIIRVDRRLRLDGRGGQAGGLLGVKDRFAQLGCRGAGPIMERTVRSATGRHWKVVGTG
jgi:hypothetical protein